MKSMKRKTIASVIFMIFVFTIATMTAFAYNTKFSFNLTSGWNKTYAYSDYATKYTTDENPVVRCTYTSGATSKFKYTVRNSNNEDRVIPIEKAGTFGNTAFERNTTQQNYKYRLGVQRLEGAWNTTASTQGLWNIDSY
ncbi:MAG: hypothetical protein VZR24_10060 [Butyrivibrio hungatei]|nr:hypothetical protein [Butyrivibrio hungatei]